jgi:hypothetical protein
LIFIVFDDYGPSPEVRLGASDAGNHPVYVPDVCVLKYGQASEAEPHGNFAGGVLCDVDMRRQIQKEMDHFIRRAGTYRCGHDFLSPLTLIATTSFSLLSTLLRVKGGAVPLFVNPSILCLLNKGMSPCQNISCEHRPFV